MFGNDALTDAQRAAVEEIARQVVGSQSSALLQNQSILPEKINASEADDADVLAALGGEVVWTTGAAPGAHASTHYTGGTDALAAADIGAAAASHTHVQADITDLSAIESGDAAGGDLSGTYPNPSVTDDSHNHTLSTVTDAGTAAALDVPATGDAAAGEVVKGSDTRLADARTPTSHASSHLTGGSDEIDGDQLNIDYTPSYYTPNSTPSQASSVDDLTAHLYGIDQQFLSVASSLGGKSGVGHTHVLADVTDAGTAAALNVPATGDAAAGEVVKGNDTRLTDARTPTTHSHAAADVTYTPTSPLSATTVQAALDEGATLWEEAANLGTAAYEDVPATGDASPSEVVLGNDSRLSDARTPTSHTHVLADVTDAGTAAALNVPAAGNAAAGEVVKGNDTRLTDARTPTSHTHTLSAITDAGTAAGSDVGDFAAASHTHLKSHITDLSAIESGDAAGGDLAGTYPNPTLAQSRVTHTEYNARKLGDISDVSASAPSSGDVLTWNATGSTWEPAAAGLPGAHASSHVRAGTDQITSDNLFFDKTASNYTPTSGYGSPASFTDQLGQHINGIDAELGIIAAGAGIDGDKLDVDWTGHTSYTPDTTPSEVDYSYQLTAHLAGIDNALAATVLTTGAQNVGGVKTFTSIPVLPGSDATTANQAIRKAQLDSEVDTLTAHACTLVPTTDRGTGTGSTTQRVFDSALVDVGSMADVANNRITIQRDGNYMIVGAVMFEGNSTGTRTTWIYLDTGSGAAAYRPKRRNPGTSADLDVDVTIGPIPLSAGDHVELWSFQNSGSPLQARGDGTAGETYLSVVEVT